jgi:hypothetical protein
LSTSIPGAANASRGISDFRVRRRGGSRTARQKTLAGAKRRSALQRAMLALVMPTHERHFALGRLQLLNSCRLLLNLLPFDRIMMGRLLHARE